MAVIRDVAVVLEAKDQSNNIAKGQIDEFDGKTTDYLVGAANSGWVWPLYRVIWSTNDVPQALRRYAALKGIIVVAPDLVPLPSLLAATEGGDVSEWFPDSSLSEFVLLAERACRPLTVLNGDRAATCPSPLVGWTPDSLDDLEYLHEAASANWLDWLDQEQPFHYERKCRECLRLIVGWDELREPHARRFESKKPL